VWLFALASVVIWGSGSDVALWGGVAFLFAVVLSTYLVLPVSAFPSVLLTLESGRMLVPTCRGLARLDLSALRSVDGRRIPGKPNDVPLVSVRDQAGGHAVLLWDSVPDSSQDALREALAVATDVTVTARAKAILRVPGAPPFRVRLKLASVTGGWWLSGLALLVLLMLRVWGGFWLWET
jgi:hypothetical protein